jgi:hypothetical protein
MYVKSCVWDQEPDGHFKTECGADGILFTRGTLDDFLSCPYCNGFIVAGTRNVVSFAGDTEGKL